ncbi:MAG: ABC transporter, permease protein [Parcubacteria group bacterium GW2011_GWA2_47_7]|nr:MAG: ABC transporter, permease protein [Parcubacteria group bacterium GW2011_GWA2_47_7]
MHYANVIYILWIRQLKRYLRSRARLVSSVAQPLLFLVALGFGFGPIYAKAGGGDYITFLAPGIIAMSMLFTSMFGGIEVIWDKQFGFLKETLVAPVPRVVIMLGRTVGGATVAMVQGLVIFLVTLVVGFRPEITPALLFAPLVMFLMCMLFTALGTAIASRLNDMQAFPLVMNFLVMPMFFLSGALFPVDQLPRALAIAVRLNPVSYGVDGMRATLINVNHFGLSVDILALALTASVVIVIGALLFNKIEA